jgi:hypothetical protein
MARAATDAGWMPGIAAVALAGAGGLHVLTAFQFFSYWHLVGWQWGAVAGIGASGLAGIALAAQIWQAKSRAAIAGAVLAPAMGLLSTGFAVYAASNLSFALYMFLAPPAAAWATLLVPFAILPSRAAERATAELREKHAGAPFGAFGG